MLHDRNFFLHAPMCHCNTCANATDVPLQQMCHCNTCAIATKIYMLHATLFEIACANVPMQHMCQCNTCAIATHVPMQHHISWINLEMSHKLMTQVLQWHICCNGASVALAHVLHWHICCNGTTVAWLSNSFCMRQCANATPFFSENHQNTSKMTDACVALAHMLQWHMCCNGTSVAMAHQSQWHICGNGTSVAMAHLLHKVNFVLHAPMCQCNIWPPPQLTRVNSSRKKFRNPDSSPIRVELFSIYLTRVNSSW